MTVPSLKKSSLKFYFHCSVNILALCPQFLRGLPYGMFSMVKISVLKLTQKCSFPVVRLIVFATIQQYMSLFQVRGTMDSDAPIPLKSLSFLLVLVWAHGIVCS